MTTSPHARRQPRPQPNTLALPTPAKHLSSTLKIKTNCYDSDEIKKFKKEKKRKKKKPPNLCCPSSSPAFTLDVGPLFLLLHVCSASSTHSTPHDVWGNPPFSSHDPSANVLLAVKNAAFWPRNPLGRVHATPACRGRCGVRRGRGAGEFDGKMKRRSGLGRGLDWEKDGCVGNVVLFPCRLCTQAKGGKAEINFFNIFFFFFLIFVLVHRCSVRRLRYRHAPLLVVHSQQLIDTLSLDFRHPRLRC
ncbi:MAG: hypothetical protein FE78DRAFT_425163 [Acidomyces sp. 'richmondensis']|nr:MAG: hypothetical protein FE78DRAFT_425163 [Acidomyces sp. 'richmondensis']